MKLSRRSMFAGLAATLAAPAIIRTPGLLMPIKPVRQTITLEAFAQRHIDRAMQLLVQQSQDGILWGDAGYVTPGADSLIIPAGPRYVRLIANVAGNVDCGITIR